GAYIRVHEKSRKKAKEKLRKLTSRSQGRSLDYIFYKLNEYMRGWLGYYGIAEMGTLMKQWNEWLRRRIRMYIWKQWKLPRTRVKNLMKLGMPDWQAYRNGNT
ncbi:MAG: group II intron maturase-specific domain-containing protein, partial [Acutalibacteraceae bacterium]|nr:group II intron maturase-specific domain-containing protein [Acutalibacteraceae bacterium]